MQYETHEWIKKKKAIEEADTIGGLGGSVSPAAMSDKIFQLIDLMIDEQLREKDEPVLHTASSATKKKQKREDNVLGSSSDKTGSNKVINIGAKMFTCSALLKILGFTILKYHDNYKVNVPPLPPQSVGVIDVLALLRSIVEDYFYELHEGKARLFGKHPKHVPFYCPSTLIFFFGVMASCRKV